MRSGDNDLPYLLPGFIDLHVHGGGGKDIMEGASAFETITKTHVRFGTTSLLATTMTAPSAEISSVLKEVGEFCEQRPQREPRECSAYTSKARTSIPANSARNRTSPTPR